MEDGSTGNLEEISKSKRGVVESMCMQLRYTPREARDGLKATFNMKRKGQSIERLHSKEKAALGISM